MDPSITVSEARTQDHAALGSILQRAYASLDGFPGPAEQPAYYEMLANIGALAQKPGAMLLAARSETHGIVGGVVYFADMAHYGSGGTATAVRNASGFRLLGVDPDLQGLGAGKALACACVELARQNRHAEVILHTTKAMGTAWALYERLGFERSADLDFMQQSLAVFGFRKRL